MSATAATDVARFRDAPLSCFSMESCVSMEWQHSELIEQVAPRMVAMKQLPLAGGTTGRFETLGIITMRNTEHLAEFIQSRTPGLPACGGPRARLASTVQSATTAGRGSFDHSKRQEAL